MDIGERLLQKYGLIVQYKGYMMLHGRWSGDFAGRWGGGGQILFRYRIIVLNAYNFV